MDRARENTVHFVSLVGAEPTYRTSTSPDQTRTRPDQTSTNPDQTHTRPDQTSTRPDQTSTGTDQESPAGNERRISETQPNLSETQTTNVVRQHPEDVEEMNDLKVVSQTSPSLLLLKLSCPEKYLRDLNLSSYKPSHLYNLTTPKYR
jgi:hypothetical protein